MSRRRYNWHGIMNTLVNEFDIRVRWDVYNRMEFSGPNGPVAVNKTNNATEGYVEEILKKLGIEKESFDSKYTH